MTRSITRLFTSLTALTVLVAGLCVGLTPTRAADDAPAAAPAAASAQPTKQPALERRVANVEKRRPLIQIAILLDTSNSMDGLIAQAKTHLWRIVNEFATAKQDGVRPELQVALFEYGNDRLPAKEGYVRQVLPLTTDLDKVSEELFALKTNGGSEWCGWVIRDATKVLSWSANTKDFKAIFIAGNEPFTQGQINYAESCKAAIAKGVVVNTIHCGDRQTGINTKWEHGAQLADGSYTHIDQNKRVVHITAPQDAEIAKLNTQLNATYVYYGRRGKEAKDRQVAQDEAAAKLAAPVLVQRAAAKSSALYSNDMWDLVDALEKKKVKLEDLKDEDLPAELRKLKPEERKAYIAKMAKQRAEIRAKIQKLADARKRYVAAEMKKRANADGGANRLDDAIVDSVRKQAQKKDFKFEK